MLNYCIKCSIPAETKGFQHCLLYTETEYNGVSDLLNQFAEAIVCLYAKVGAFTIAGENSGVGCCINKLNKNSFKFRVLSKTTFHISCADSRRFGKYWPIVAIRLVLSLTNMRR